MIPVSYKHCYKFHSVCWERCVEGIGVLCWMCYVVSVLLGLLCQKCCVGFSVYGVVSVSGGSVGGNVLWVLCCVIVLGVLC